jgi:HD-like signal output (HDOD) protein
MHIFDDNDDVSPIYHRAISLTLGKEFAEDKGNTTSLIAKQNSEQENRRRKLLDVEEQANEARIIKEHGKSHFKTQMMAKFYGQVSAKVNNEFDNKENLYANILHIEDAAPDIMEILSVRAASIKRISPLVKSLPWLADELIALVNKPQYRKRADVQVSDPNLALTYVGLENLKLVMPTFMLKHWLPTSTAPFALMKRKLWNDALSVALASQKLAEQYDIDPFTAFSAGMLSNIGLLAVTRCFLQTYNELYKQELKTAYDARDKRLHDVLVDFEVSPELLLEQLITRNSKIAADLVELMRFDRLAITEPLFDLAYTADFDKMSPVAQIVVKAKAYVAFRSLAKEGLIENEESKLLLNAANVTTKEVTLLKKADIDHIKLSFK